VMLAAMSVAMSAVMSAAMWDRLPRWDTMMVATRAVMKGTMMVAMRAVM
jgi:hypothetical protein